MTDPQTAVVAHLQAVATIVVPDMDMSALDSLERVQSALRTVERRIALVDHLIASIGTWEPA